MHARPLVLIVMLMFAASAHADNAIREQLCAERALDVCGESSGDDYEIVKAHCLAAFWITLSHSNQVCGAYVSSASFEWTRLTRSSHFLYFFIRWDVIAPLLLDQCPHPAVNCRCYNGCVQDRSGSVRDVGGWCTDTCRKSLQDSTCS
ncbi:hypothetical protein V8E36_006821 [Tilletia maclaganii]